MQFVRSVYGLNGFKSFFMNICKGSYEHQDGNVNVMCDNKCKCCYFTQPLRFIYALLHSFDMNEKTTKGIFFSSLIYKKTCSSCPG